MEKEVMVIKLGGSVIVGDRLNVAFLNRFRLVLEGFFYKFRFIVVCGGGKLCRTYQHAAQLLNLHSSEELDRIGVRATMLNAEFVRAIFGEQAEREIQYDYFKKRNFRNLLVCSGWLPGHSSDFGAVMFARRYGCRSLVMLTDVPYVFDRDPRKFPDAKPLERIKLEDYLAIVGTRFEPGMNFPIDPIAAKNLSRGMRVRIIRGVENLEKLLLGDPHEGTWIEA